MKTLSLLRMILLVAISLFIFPACDEDVAVVQQGRPPVNEFDASVMLRWNQVFLELDRFAEGYRSGPSAHALAYLGFLAYEAVSPGMPGYHSLAGLYPGLALPEFDETLEYHWPAVINESYAYLMGRLFFHMENSHPDLYQKIEETRLELRAKYLQETSPEVLGRSESRGNSIAVSMNAWEETDLGHHTFLHPQPPFMLDPLPGRWAPTVPDFSSAMHPLWGDARIFAGTVSDLLVYQPQAYSEDPNSVFFNQAMEVLAHQHPTLSYTDEWIAEFWSDDLIGLTFSPPARFVGIANQIIDKENSDLAQAVELYAKLGMALSDASVAAWRSKYYYQVERPISYIHRVIAPNNPDAAEFLPALDNPLNGLQGFTPPYPGYPSAHASFASAACKILSSVFEYTDEHPSGYAFTDYCHANRPEFEGVPRTFGSFQDMALEAAYSRVLLGVNFRMDCDAGLHLGDMAADRVLELPWKE